MNLFQRVSYIEICILFGVSVAVHLVERVSYIAVHLVERVIFRMYVSTPEGRIIGN